MIIYFRCPPRLKEQVDELVERGLYPDFSSFCTIAIQNQLLVEESDSKGGSGAPLTKKLETAKDHKVAGPSTSPEDQAARPKPIEPRNGEPTKGSLSLPEELRQSGPSKDPPFALPGAGADVFEPGQLVPVDRWLFGQYNRLLPAKVSIRALASVASREGKESLVLESVAARIAEIASEFGDYLRLLDRKFAAHRDDALSTAFPEKSSDGQKGRVRYQNQFVGHTVKGEQGGLLVGLKLATIQVIKNKPHILPTRTGWQFALLENPLLDSLPVEAEQKLTQVERAFLLEHIRGHVPVEAFAYAVILSLIEKGVCSPEAMNTALAQFLSPGRLSTETKEFVNTQRSGALGRMTDLGLVSHERDGRHVSRGLTPEGKRFLENVGQFEVAPMK